MGKVTIERIGTITIKMDVRDDMYADAKPPHVSFVQNGREILSHVYLSDIDDIVGYDSDTKKAIYWVRDHKYELEQKYKELNKI